MAALVVNGQMASTTQAVVAAAMETLEVGAAALAAPAAVVLDMEMEVPPHPQQEQQTLVEAGAVLARV